MKNKYTPKFYENLKDKKVIPEAPVALPPPELKNYFEKEFKFEDNKLFFEQPQPIKPIRMEPKQIRILNRPGEVYIKPTHCRELRIPGNPTVYPLSFAYNIYITWPMVVKDILKYDPTFKYTMKQLLDLGASVYNV